MKLIFLDTETSGLDPRRHEIWELFWKEYELEDELEDSQLQYIETKHFQMDILFTEADLIALNIGGFFEPGRRKFGFNSTCTIDGNSYTGTTKADIARYIQHRWHNAVLVGANPAFDQSFLTPFMHQQGYLPTWGYHLCDIRALVNGYLAGQYQYEDQPHDHPFQADFLPPWKGKRERTCELLGLDPLNPLFKEHTAEGDTNLVIAQFAIVMGLEADL